MTELLICDNCWNWITPNQNFYELAHIDQARQDLHWTYTYHHVQPCTPIRLELFREAA